MLKKLKNGPWPLNKKLTEWVSLFLLLGKTILLVLQIWSQLK
jgi:hypothetical protein